MPDCYQAHRNLTSAGYSASSVEKYHYRLCRSSPYWKQSNIFGPGPDLIRIFRTEIDLGFGLAVVFGSSSDHQIQGILFDRGCKANAGVVVGKRIPDVLNAQTILADEVVELLAKPRSHSGFISSVFREMIIGHK